MFPSIFHPVSLRLSIYYFPYLQVTLLVTTVHTETLKIQFTLWHNNSCSFCMVFEFIARSFPLIILKFLHEIIIQRSFRINYHSDFQLCGTDEVWRDTTQFWSILNDHSQNKQLCSATLCFDQARGHRPQCHFLAYSYVFIITWYPSSFKLEKWHHHLINITSTFRFFFAVKLSKSRKVNV